MKKNIKQILGVFFTLAAVTAALAAATDFPSISVLVNGHTTLHGDPISPTPRFDVAISSVNTLASGQISLDSTTTALTFVRSGNNYYGTYEVTSALADGIHGITIEAFDSLGNAATSEVFPLYVQEDNELTIQGVPLNYPNPFNAGAENTTIGYTLSKPADITLSIFNLSGTLIARKNYLETEAGGRAGYNEITWDGKSDGGAYVGNGIYVYLIVANGKVAQNGTGKLTVFKQ